MQTLYDFIKAYKISYILMMARNDIKNNAVKLI